MKVVINTCTGGYSLSKEAQEFLCCTSPYSYYDERNNFHLVKCVEALGEKANGKYTKLKIIEIPDDTLFYVIENHGNETIHESHRIWDKTGLICANILTVSIKINIWNYALEALKRTKPFIYQIYKQLGIAGEENSGDLQDEIIEFLQHNKKLP